MSAGPVQGLQGLRRREIDLTATRASFEARAWHGRVAGIVPVLSGHILVDGDGAPAGVVAELDLNAISTGNPRRDKDLRSRRFFDTAQHPVARFDSHDVVSGVGGGWEVRGVLSIGGVQCPVKMQVRAGGDSYDGYVGTVPVTKAELGVRAPNLLVRPAITLSINTRLI